MNGSRSDSGPDSYVVSKFGLDGKREHWMPGNRRRGTGPREKKPFSSADEAWEFVRKWGLHPDTRIYQCSICGAWHTASPKRGA